MYHPALVTLVFAAFALCDPTPQVCGIKAILDNSKYHYYSMNNIIGIFVPIFGIRR